MATPLLETKLHQPTTRPGYVDRPRLLERMERGSASRLLLVSAPAGFGKTTVLAQWLGTRAHQRSSASRSPHTSAVAWVSLDSGDDDPRTFWTYVVAALHRSVPEIGADVLALLRAPDPPPVRELLVTLLNDLTAQALEVVLVLDDYHVIGAAEVHESIAFLVEHAPPGMHVVLASREDPGLPLGRLRARGELTELRIADLRFTPDEAAAYLNHAMGLTLTPEQVTALEGRTEGWIAALQLAALSLQGRGDSAGFIDDFAGDDRYIVDYLVEEVLQRQPGDVGTFLLETSLLDRLTASLCDAVTSRSDGRAMLATLERGNLFVVPLDDRRQWYRYHHLFADVLRVRLLDESPEHVRLLHRRASDWYEQHDQRAEAIEHAMAGGHHDRAAELIELAMPDLLRERREATQRMWIGMLPDEVVQARPVLCVGYVGAMLSTGEVAGVERWLDVAERWADAILGGSSAGMVAVDEVELARLPCWVANYRAAHAMLREQVDEAVTWAGRAFDLARPDDHLARGAASALLGIGAWSKGDLEAAHAAYEDCTADMLAVGHVADALGCAITLAEIRIAQGRLSGALRTFEGALQLGEAPEDGGPVPRGTADMYVGMSVVHRERNDLASARACLARSDELGDHLGLRQNRYRSRVAMARVREAEGELEAAESLLAEAERLYDGDFMPEVRPVSALLARVRIRQGRLDDAFAWARERGLSSADEPSYLREFEHVTLARALLAKYAADRASEVGADLTGLLQRLLLRAEEGGRTGTVIELLVLQALAHQVRADMPASLVALERALVLAEPEAYARIFLDEGGPMLRLLEAAAARDTAPGYARRLVSGPLAEPPPPHHGSPATTGSLVVEQLSQREHDVLRLLATDLGGPEIARELVLSLNTVRTHTRSIYTKLGVTNRRAAVRRARELDLLTGRAR